MPKLSMSARTAPSVDRRQLQRLADQLQAREEMKATIMRLTDEVKALDQDLCAQLADSPDTDDEGRPMIDVSDVSDTFTALKLVKGRSAARLNRDVLIRKGVKLSVLAVATIKGTAFAYPMPVRKAAAKAATKSPTQKRRRV